MKYLFVDNPVNKLLKMPLALAAKPKFLISETDVVFEIVVL